LYKNNSYHEQFEELSCKSKLAFTEFDETVNVAIFLQLNESPPFTCTCNFYGIEAEGTGLTKKRAKHAAATAVLQQLDFDSLPPPTKKKSKSSSKSLPDFPAHLPPNGPLLSNPNRAFPLPNGSESTNSKFDELDSATTNDVVQNKKLPCFPSLPISQLDRFVIEKHKQIYPDEWQLTLILNLAKAMEECMWHVAEAVNASGEVSGLDGGNKMTGMTRVGDLAKSLLLRSSREIQVRCLKKHNYYNI
jgi:hypothetical protein